MENETLRDIAGLGVLMTLLGAVQFWAFFFAG